MNILIKKYIPENFLAKNQDIIGFIQGTKAFNSPQILQLDIINTCNLDCLACWCHSPHVGEYGLTKEEKKQILPYSKIKETIDILSSKGLKEVQISGAGEPFLHPQILEIIQLIKSYNLRLNIITNFTLMNEELIKKLVELKVDYITASIWAGTIETYAKLHPNQNPNMFIHLGEMLKLLFHLKQKENKPQVKIYNVISHLNCHELHQMLDFALNCQADFLEFTVVDIVKGKTDFLKLTDKDKLILAEGINQLKEKINYPDTPGTWQLENLDNQKHKEEFKEFGRYMRNTIPKDFQLNIQNKELTCPKKLTSTEVFCDEFNECAFFFSFNNTACATCLNKHNCPAGLGHKIKASFLSIIGFGSFWRRVLENETPADLQIVDSIPCYAGWIYTKIAADGNIIPCCKAHKKPVGNIFEDNFWQIWNFKKQQLFRYHGKYTKKNNFYYNEINCYKACDNLGMNLSMHEKIQALSPFKKTLLYAIAKLNFF